MNAIDLFVKKHSLSSEAEDELRVLMRGEFVGTNALGHEPIRPDEMVVIAEMASLNLTKRQAYEFFRQKLPRGFQRSARWIRDQYMKAWNEHSGTYDYSEDHSPMAKVEKAIGNAESHAAAWFVAKDPETRSARWADFVKSLHEIANHSRQINHWLLLLVAEEALRGGLPYRCTPSLVVQRVLLKNEALLSKENGEEICTNHGIEKRRCGCAAGD
jgi:hypothetical protein